MTETTHRTIAAAHSAESDTVPQIDANRIVTDLTRRLDRHVVLVGLMGAGKSSIGRRLAALLDMPFVDADTEIENAAGCTIQEIFDEHGEQAFRDGERKVIERLLSGQPIVLGTGGGAYMNPETRTTIAGSGISVWLRAPHNILLKRVLRRNNRPLLKRGNPSEILQDLIEKRYPVYAEADLVVDSDDGPHDVIVNAIATALHRHLLPGDQDSRR